MRYDQIKEIEEAVFLCFFKQCEDLYFIKIMIALNYGENIIFERCKWLQWTWINYFWHWLRGKKPKNKIPII